MRVDQSQIASSPARSICIYICTPSSSNHSRKTKSENAIAAEYVDSPNIDSFRDRRIISFQSSQKIHMKNTIPVNEDSSSSPASEIRRPLDSMASHRGAWSQKHSLHTHTSRQAKQNRLLHTNVQVRQLTKDRGSTYRSG